MVSKWRSYNQYIAMMKQSTISWPIITWSHCRCSVVAWPASSVYIQTLLLKAMYVCTYLANVDLIVLTLTEKVLENNFIYLCQNFNDSFFTSLVNFLKTITNRFLLLQEHICWTDSAKSKTTIIYLQVIEHKRGPFTRHTEDVCHNFFTILVNA